MNIPLTFQVLTLKCWFITRFLTEISKSKVEATSVVKQWDVLLITFLYDYMTTPLWGEKQSPWQHWLHKAYPLKLHQVSGKLLCQYCSCSLPDYQILFHFSNKLITVCFVQHLTLRINQQLWGVFVNPGHWQPSRTTDLKQMYQASIFNFMRDGEGGDRWGETLKYHLCIIYCVTG